MIPHFFYSRPIQDIVVMESGTKPVITPTNQSFSKPPKNCDIHFFNGYVQDMYYLCDSADIQ